MRPAVELKGIVKRFPGVLANDRASLVVAPGEVHALLGENGAGKSTLMQILYGSFQADEGEILLDGLPVVLARQRDAIQSGIGMIHQDFMLVRPFTVVENVVLGLGAGRGGVLDLGRAAARIKELSQKHGLDIDPWARIDHLPVGVQQRVRWQVVLLRQRKRRARHLDRVVTGEVADHGAGGCGLAGAEVARQRDDIAGPDQQREVGHQVTSRRFVDERGRKCGRCYHSAALRCAV